MASHRLHRQSIGADPLPHLRPVIGSPGQEIIIIWDYQNVRIPQELEPADVLRLLHEFFIVRAGPRRCCGAYATFTDQTKRAVGERRFNQFSSNGVLNVMMVNAPGGPRKADDADNALTELMLSFTVTCLQSGRTGVILLITGDADFVRPAVWCRQQGCVQLELLYMGECAAREIRGLSASWKMEWRDWLDCCIGGRRPWTFPYPQQLLNPLPLTRHAGSPLAPAPPPALPAPTCAPCVVLVSSGVRWAGDGASAAAGSPTAAAAAADSDAAAPAPCLEEHVAVAAAHVGAVIGGALAAAGVPAAARPPPPAGSCLDAVLRLAPAERVAAALHALTQQQALLQARLAQLQSLDAACDGAGDAGDGEAEEPGHATPSSAAATSAGHPPQQPAGGRDLGAGAAPEPAPAPPAAPVGHHRVGRRKAAAAASSSSGAWVHQAGRPSSPRASTALPPSPAEPPAPQALGGAFGGGQRRLVLSHALRCAHEAQPAAAAAASDPGTPLEGGGSGGSGGSGSSGSSCGATPCAELPRASASPSARAAPATPTGSDDLGAAAWCSPAAVDATRAPAASHARSHNGAPQSQSQNGASQPHSQDGASNRRARALARYRKRRRRGQGRRRGSRGSRGRGGAAQASAPAPRPCPSLEQVGSSGEAEEEVICYHPGGASSPAGSVCSAAEAAWLTPSCPPPPSNAAAAGGGATPPTTAAGAPGPVSFALSCEALSRSSSAGSDDETDTSSGDGGSDEDSAHGAGAFATPASLVASDSSATDASCWGRVPGGLILHSSDAGSSQAETRGGGAEGSRSLTSQEGGVGRLRPCLPSPLLVPTQARVGWAPQGRRLSGMATSATSSGA